MQPWYGDTFILLAQKRLLHNSKNPTSTYSAEEIQLHMAKETTFRISPSALIDSHAITGSRPKSRSQIVASMKQHGFEKVSANDVLPTTELETALSFGKVPASPGPHTPWLAGGKPTPQAPAMMMDYNPLFEKGLQRHRKTDAQQGSRADASSQDQNLHCLLSSSNLTRHQAHEVPRNLQDTRRSRALDQYLDDSEPMLLQLRQLEENAGGP